MSGFQVLWWIFILPLAGGGVSLLLPQRARAWAKGVGILASGATLLLSLTLLSAAERAGAFRNAVELPWLDAPWPIAFRLGVDGVSVVLVILTALVSLLAVVAASGRQDRPGGLIGLLLLLEGCTLGLFLSLDLVFFYFFWDLMLIPSYLLLSGWGGEGGRAAGLKYIIYNGAGGLALLLGVVAIGLFGGSFDLTALTTSGGLGGLSDSAGWTGLGGPEGLNALQPLGGAAASLGATALWSMWSTWAFLGVALAFIIKIPLFPFHGWMPDTYEHAPFPAAAFLSGVQSKAGLYGLLRVALPLFPVAARAFAPILIGLALAGVVYGALIALSRRGARGVVAYSSLSHLGLIVVALFAFHVTASQGAVLQMANHGIFTAGLFLILAAVEARTGTLDLGRLGGLGAKTPILSAAFLIVSLGALGMPGLNGFAGEFLMLLGISQVSMWYVGIALFAVVVAAAYMLRLFQGIMQGPPGGGIATEAVGDDGRRSRKRAKRAGRSGRGTTRGARAATQVFDLGEAPDLSWREAVSIVPLSVLVIWLGVQPAPIPERVAPSPSIAAALGRVGSAGRSADAERAGVIGQVGTTSPSPRTERAGAHERIGGADPRVPDGREDAEIAARQIVSE